MSTLNRRTALLSLGALAAAPAAAVEEAAPPIPGASPFLSTGKEIPVSVSSHPVRWNGHDYRLVGIHKARFSLSTLGRLTGVLTGSVSTFDSVDYDVHGAVFDATGRLLGTAATVCSVERIWVGVLGMGPVELRLDFGVSEAYRRGEWFTLGISERKVLTPDDWAPKKKDEG